MLLFNPVFRLAPWRNAPGLSASGLGEDVGSGSRPAGLRWQQSELVD